MYDLLTSLMRFVKLRLATALTDVTFLLVLDQYMHGQQSESE